jgi:hypothetical protein
VPKYLQTLKPSFSFNRSLQAGATAHVNLLLLPPRKMAKQLAGRAAIEDDYLTAIITLLRLKVRIIISCCLLR